MEESLDLCLQELQSSSESLNNIHFKPPGIFHNALTRLLSPNTTKQEAIPFTKVIRDRDPEEEDNLFSYNKKRRIPARTDGEKGILDYLRDREITFKGNPTENIPLVHVPNEIYLRQNDARWRKENKLSHSWLYQPNDSQHSQTNFTTQGSIGMTKSHTDRGVLERLFTKYSNDTQMIQLLKALQSGSITVGTTDNISPSKNNRRKTMFVEDFQTESLFLVLEEVTSQFPSEENRVKYQTLWEEYSTLTQQVTSLKEDIEYQTYRLNNTNTNNHASSPPSKSVADMIAKEEREIERLQTELNEKKLR
ncbi:hypothetical protein TBLA_0H03070 [Henningerozyma blattae CBS 6284]|uniref:DASH complex subunit SPC34 n=1 Tax=Henningerozyma blattae (strain ATCC 34711 / CBS 6284 / DSM 70876 / NBRC 10599 / NRRL Y-10934 / UCD 77-7) TaxID=1071380 RepID=I2H886_HENB6|nr:hypothetical protein TBLA_0H03070 [Tetrapisispora blattae CBS 6284]CCH62588.1 hypothetical protein TBLA_0H03070 [Tetrapisispora blattae CBS 6284]